MMSHVFHVALIAIAIISIYLDQRNNSVYDFRNKIMSRSSWRNYCEVYKILRRHSYKRMLFSFKPLKLEAWFTIDEIKTIKGE